MSDVRWLAFGAMHFFEQRPQDTCVTHIPPRLIHYLLFPLRNATMPTSPDNEEPET
jgi:hypothetical protein